MWIMELCDWLFDYAVYAYSLWGNLVIQEFGGSCVRVGTNAHHLLFSSIVYVWNILLIHDMLLWSLSKFMDSSVIYYLYM